MAEKKEKAAATETPKAKEAGKAPAAPKAKAPAKEAPKAKAEPAAAKAKAAPTVNRLKKHYTDNVIPQLEKHFSYKNINEVPKIEKIVINAGLGDTKDNAKSFQLAVNELKQISGQNPVVTKAKKSVANFKLREGMSIGAKVTLRGGRMYEFMDKLISIALPRVRDFRGVSPNSFDGRGNYTMGVKEQLIFPEIVYDQVEKTRGFDITFVTTAGTDEEARQLLQLMGMPFRA